MRNLSKIIFFCILCSFAFTASAGSILCCLDMSDITDTQQNPENTTSKNCHSDQNPSSDETLNDCCQDMNSCSGSTLFISNASLITMQATQQAVQSPSQEQLVLNTDSPPTPPPKLTY